jgi:hypothetical protein
MPVFDPVATTLITQDSTSIKEGPLSVNDVLTAPLPTLKVIPRIKQFPVML